MSVLKEGENELRVDVGVIFPSSMRTSGGQGGENVGSVLQVCVYATFLSFSYSLWSLAIRENN